MSSIINTAATINMNSPTWVLIVITAIVMLFLPVMPRFVLNIREMHGREMRDRLQGIDTAFGLSSCPIASRNTEISAVLFAEGASDSEMLGAQDDEEIQLELIQLRGRSRGRLGR